MMIEQLPISWENVFIFVPQQDKNKHTPTFLRCYNSSLVRAVRLKISHSLGFFVIHADLQVAARRKGCYFN